VKIIFFELPFEVLSRDKNVGNEDFRKGSSVQILGSLEVGRILPKEKAQEVIVDLFPGIPRTESSPSEPPRPEKNEKLSLFPRRLPTTSRNT